MRKGRLWLFILIQGISLILLLHTGGKAQSGKPFHILISNDDGIKAPGIQALATALSKMAKVTVAAPSENWSGAGHGLTFGEPLIVETWESEGTKWHAISALPASCVRLALTSLLSEKPDFVVSGINRGENVGVITYSSATVACAREAAFHGIPAIAVSLQYGKTMDNEGAADFVAKLVEEVKKRRLPPGTYLNVNYPALSKEQIRGVLETQQDLRPPDERYEKRIKPDGTVYFWSVYKPLERGNEKTDVWALTNGYISITPFDIDQTHAPLLKSLKSLRLDNQKRR